MNGDEDVWELRKENGLVDLVCEWMWWRCVSGCVEGLIVCVGW